MKRSYRGRYEVMRSNRKDLTKAWQSQKTRFSLDLPAFVDLPVCSLCPLW